MHLQTVAIQTERFPTTERYPFNLDIFRSTDSLEFTTPVTFFVGENGSGKSTLLKGICRRCGIHIWEGMDRTRYEVNPYEEKLFHVLDVEWSNGPVPGSFFASTLFRNFSQLLDDWAAANPGILEYFGGHSLLTQSHGQSLLSFFRSRYRVKGLYFLDEPESALSPRSQIQLLKVLNDASESGNAQFLIATHSPILLACPKATILSFDRSPIQSIEYMETEYYTLYREFLENPDRFLQSLE